MLTTMEVPQTLTDVRQRVWEEGVDAWHRQVKRVNNPYGLADALWRQAWFDGWDHEDDRIEEMLQWHW